MAVECDDVELHCGHDAQLGPGHNTILVKSQILDFF